MHQQILDTIIVCTGEDLWWRGINWDEGVDVFDPGFGLETLSVLGRYDIQLYLEVFAPGVLM